MTSEELSGDLSKVLGEWALAAGRLLQSEKTGFIHLTYGELDQPSSQTIPFLENALFVLALFRSRLVDNIQEAKQLLKRLLAFQNQEEGNFPVYLHDYPFCQDPAMGISLLAPFYWTLKLFGHVLGADLKRQLEQVSEHLLSFSLTVHANKPFPYFLHVRLAASQLAIGKLLNKQEWQQAGEQQLQDLTENQLIGWWTTHQLGEMLIGLQMVYPSIANSPWNLLWKRMEHTWHVKTGCYMGPCLREWQEREEPQPNLYDLFAGYFSGRFSRRTTLTKPFHLYAALTQPSPDHLAIDDKAFVEGTFKQQHWEAHQEEVWAYTLLEKKESMNPATDKTYTPFRLVWGDLQVTHSLVCQGGHYEKVEYDYQKDQLTLIFHLSSEVPSDERDKQREIEFFIDFHADVRFKVEERPVNTFELGHPLTILLNEKILLFTCELVEGEGHFLGHVMKGNRPSQIDHKGEKRFHAYDWTFFIRTVRRQGPCVLRCTFTL